MMKVVLSTKNIVKQLKKVMKFVKKNKKRVLLYLFLILVSIASFCAVMVINEDADKKALAIEQAAVSIEKYAELESKKLEYQEQGVDVTEVEETMSRIYDAIYTEKDYTLALNLIDEANIRLEELHEKYLENKRIEEELRKGDLLGSVKCEATLCSSGADVTLSRDGQEVSTAQVDANGNFSFHIDAGSYTLSANSSGYMPTTRTNISIVAQNQVVINFNLKKIVKSTVTGGSTDSSTDDSAPSGGESGSQPDQNIVQLFSLINDYRSKNGLSTLSLDSSLNRAAQSHSNWMNATKTLSHTGENGSTPWARCAAVGTSCSGEIIYQGPNLHSAFSAWKNSPPHDAIMLTGKFSAMGIGISGRYFTVDFR